MQRVSFRPAQHAGTKGNFGPHTVSITGWFRRFPVHGFLHRLLPAGVAEFALCKHTEAVFVNVLLGAPPRRRRRRQLAVPSVLICGSDFSDVTSLRSSGFRLHTLTPSAAPAAMAAPRAVVSGIDGFTVGYNASSLPSRIKETLKDMKISMDSCVLKSLWREVSF